jgi:prepilin peptidase CpaA
MPIGVYVFLFLQLAVVAYVDYLKKRISNYWSILNLAVYPILLFICPDSYEFSFSTFFIPLIFFGVGYVGFLLKLVGAGDTKFLFALFLLVPLPLHEQMFICLAWATVIVGFSLFLVNTIKNFDKIILAWGTKDVRIIKGIYGKKFSFAPVIFLSWMWFGWQIEIYKF